MKKNIFKSVLQLSVVLVAVFGAFAFNEAPEAALVTVDKIGVIPGSCEFSNTLCSTEFDDQRCQEGGQDLNELNMSGTACPDPLYRIQ